MSDDNLYYHPACARRLFGKIHAPVLEYTRDNIENLALQVLENNTALTGVQPKLSLEINRGEKNEPDKMTIVGLCGWVTENWLISRNVRTEEIKVKIFYAGYVPAYKQVDGAQIYGYISAVGSGL